MITITTDTEIIKRSICSTHYSLYRRMSLRRYEYVVYVLFLFAQAQGRNYTYSQFGLGDRTENLPNKNQQSISKYVFI